jgi:hypothetical protein
VASELQVIGTMKDAHGRTVKIGVRGGRVEVVITPHSGHDGRMGLDAVKQEEFAQHYIAACLQAKVNAAQAAESYFPPPNAHDERRRATHALRERAAGSGRDVVEQAARALIGIPDTL